MTKELVFRLLERHRGAQGILDWEKDRIELDPGPQAETSLEDIARPRRGGPLDGHGGLGVPSSGRNKTPSRLDKTQS